MKKIFIDTNVITDLIADRKHFNQFAVEVFTKAENKSIKLYISSHATATTHYLFKKHIGEKELPEILNNLTKFISFVTTDEVVIKKALKSKCKDFENAKQIITAYAAEKIDCIVTRNIKEFKNCEIPVFSPDELIKKI